MTRLADKAEIRRRLNQDREWSLYALADLDDGLFEHCDWLGCGDGLALVFRALAIRPIFVIGDAAATRQLLAALPESSGYLNLKPHQLDAACEVFEFRQRHEMRRMLLADFRPRVGATEPLTREDSGALERLFASGDGGGIAFAPFQMDNGFFRGIWRGGQLVAAAGAQVVSRHEGVAAIGNIFTHPEFRGQGLAQIATSAVAAALRAAGIETIGLNVADGNTAAARAYERVGFRTCFRYYEGPAVKKRPDAPQASPHLDLVDLPLQFLGLKAAAPKAESRPAGEQSDERQHVSQT
ncbi:MAG TPA: GNAT family N-acetyltransferase, partial [Candidatus Solibacter sp.]|nr:GNAT family N-acetyltransferase [Candidatus Solibacter sp.]